MPACIIIRPVVLSSNSRPLIWKLSTALCQLHACLYHHQACCPTRWQYATDLKIITHYCHPSLIITLLSHHSKMSQVMSWYDYASLTSTLSACLPIPGHTMQNHPLQVQYPHQAMYQIIPHQIIQSCTMQYHIHALHNAMYKHVISLWLPSHTWPKLIMISNAFCHHAHFHRN